MGGAVLLPTTRVTSDIDADKANGAAKVARFGSISCSSAFFSFSSLPLLPFLSSFFTKNFFNEENDMLLLLTLKNHKQKLKKKGGSTEQIDK